MMRPVVAFHRCRMPLLRKGLPLSTGLLLGVAAAVGCRAVETHADYPADLYHPDYVKRSKAVAEFAGQRDRKQLPKAFQLLLDDDANIRLVAYLTIRDLSPGAEDFGYRPYLSQDVRFGIVTRWQVWWVKNGETPGKGAAEPATAAEAAKGAAAAEAAGTAEAARG